MNNLILVTGFSGVGKTTIGKQIAKRLPGIYLDKDTLSQKWVDTLLIQKGLEANDRENKFYVDKLRPLEYEVLEDVAYENLSYQNVILSAPYVREINDLEWYENMKLKANTHNSRLTIVWVYCKLETMKQNIISRNSSRDNSKQANWNKYFESFDFQMIPVCPHILVDNSNYQININNLLKDIEV